FSSRRNTLMLPPFATYTSWPEASCATHIGSPDSPWLATAFSAPVFWLTAKTQIMGTPCWNKKTKLLLRLTHISCSPTWFPGRVDDAAGVRAPFLPMLNACALLGDVTKTYRPEGITGPSIALLLIAVLTTELKLPLVPSTARVTISAPAWSWANRNFRLPS